MYVLPSDDFFQQSLARCSRLIPLPRLRLNCVVFCPVLSCPALQRRRALDSDLEELDTARTQLKEREVALSSKASNVEVRRCRGMSSAVM